MASVRGAVGGAVGRTVQRLSASRRAAHEPEHRSERPAAPYVGPVTSVEWGDAFAEMAAEQPDEYAELTGQRFTR